MCGGVGGCQMDFLAALCKSQCDRGGNRCLADAAFAHGEDDFFVLCIQRVHEVVQPMQLCPINLSLLLLLEAVLCQHGADVGNAGDGIRAKRHGVLCQLFQFRRHIGKSSLLLSVQLGGQHIIMLHEHAVDDQQLILDAKFPQLAGGAIGFLQRGGFRPCH